MCWQIIAAKALKTESMKVYRELENGDLERARSELSRIVSRDTGALDEARVVKSAVEAVSENTTDGVTAPLIFLLIWGAPLGFFYKAVNTLDSMIGYKNDEYLWFGRTAAKLDDALNYIPARISAVMMIAASQLCGYNRKNAVKVYLRDKRNHPSPNSAQTESVCAGALGIQIAGPNYYFGELVDKPLIGDDLRPVEKEDIRRANRLMYCTFALTLAAGVLIRLAVWRLTNV
jgi:adenosylcobinamide-phosphate synthase